MSRVEHRFSYAVIMLFVGIAVGFVLGFLGNFISPEPHFNKWVAVFTTVYFVAIGITLGEYSADFVGTAFRALLTIFFFWSTWVSDIASDWIGDVWPEWALSLLYTVVWLGGVAWCYWRH
jgi:hypothetical protein